MNRGRINGRHFDLMRRLIERDAALPESKELRELQVWGYVTREGTYYAVSNAGRIAWDTWNSDGVE